MLKKFLTTIIVFAATATAWADGYSYTLDKDNTRATISADADSENTIDDVITAIKGLSPKVQYVILPDGMSKAEVNSIATENGFVVAVSKNQATAIEKYYTYTLFGQEPVEISNQWEITDGKAKINRSVDLEKIGYTYTNGNEIVSYEGNNFLYGQNDKLYAGLDIERNVILTKMENQYIYDNGNIVYPSTEPRTSDNQWGIIDYTPESAVELSLNQQVAYTYKVGDLTYAYNGKAYNNNGLVFYDGGTEYSDVTESTEKYTYISDGAILEYSDANGVNYVLNDNTTPWGNVGGTKINLIQGNDTYTYNGAIYTGYVSGENPYYGIADGDALPLSTISNPYTYISDGKTYVYNGDVYTEQYNNNSLWGGVFYKLTYAPNNYYTYNDPNDGITYIYEGNVTWEDNICKGTVDGNEVILSSNVVWYAYWYTIDGEKKIGINPSTCYKKKDDTSGELYICKTTPYALSQYNGELKYYTNAESQNVIYESTGKIFKSQDSADTKEYGCLNPIELKYGPVYLKEDESLFTGKVYCTVDGETTTYYGFEGGEDVELSYAKYCNEGEILVTDATRLSTDGTTYCVGGDPVALTVAGYNANLYEVNDKNVVYEGKVYGEKTGYTVGTPVQLTYGNVYTYNNGDTDIVYNGAYLSEDKTIGYLGEPTPLTVTYTYTDPVTGETANLTSDKHLSSPYSMTFEVAVEEKEREVEVAGKYHIIAYVSIPGSLYFAIDDKWYGGNDLTALTLSGSLNYADIGNGGYPLAMNKYGHAIYDTYSYDPETNQTTMSTITPSDDIQEGAVENKNCAFTNVTNLQYIDFSDAKFNVNTDMQIARGMTYNVEKVKTVYLPKDDSFTIIPAGCLINAKGITEICIPKNIKIIEGKAFHNTALSHIYTTSDNEDVIVDNGPKTITLPAGLEEIRSAGNGTESTFTGSGMDIITDVYVLSEKAPKCAPYSFQGSMTFGNKGFQGNWAHPIGRHIYVNGKQMITVLHFPSSCTTEETKKYTDITRNYTLADETGAVDGKGKTMIWPRHAQFWRAFNQATMGYIWSDWEEYNGVDKEVIMEWSSEIVKEQTTKYDRAYQGWHEFVLTGTSASQTIQVQEETEFIQRDWYTLCVPYNLRKSHLLELFGIDGEKSANNKVKMLKETESKDVTETMYPDIRVITEISRSVTNGKMAIHLSKPLLNDSEGKNWEVIIPEDGKGYEYNELDGDDPIIIKGGHPFLVRGYVPAAWNDQIKNMGMYIMAIAASDNSAAVLEGKEEPYKYNDECLVNGVALPCVKHHIHARNFDYSENDANNKNQFVFKDAAHSDAACYHFIGTYTETKIPQYAYYIGKAGDGSHKFSRTTKTSFKWAPYSAVIVGLNKPNYNDNDFAGGKTSIQNIIVGLETPTNDLVILEGEDPARAGQALSIKFDEDAFSGEATGIIDINIDSNVSVSNNKVYSINGQYMGTSLNKLPKGIYIINGQKKVVK